MSKAAARAAADDAQAVMAMGARVLAQESEALAALGEGLDERFVAVVRELLDCRGMVLLTGIGKSGLVARKLAATLTSTGTPSHFIHPVEAVHGDLGIVRQADMLMAVSRSGNNPEVVDIAGRCRQLGMRTVALTGREKSPLSDICHLVLPIPVDREACPLDLTPTTSAVAAMAMGDALAMTLITLRGFKVEDFAMFHPSGVLGRSLLVRVGELMHTGDELPLVKEGMTLRQCLPEIVDKRLGGTCIVDGRGKLCGVCVDGDVKRVLLANDNALELPIDEVMNPAPTTVNPDMLAVSALRIMENRPQGPVTLLIVTDGEDRPVGLLHIHDILKAGLL